MIKKRLLFCKEPQRANKIDNRIVSVIKAIAKIFLLTEVGEKIENEFVKNELFYAAFIYS